MSKLDQYKDTEKKDTRSGFGAAMDILGDSNPNVIALCADLTGSLKLNDFQAILLNKLNHMLIYQMIKGVLLSKK